MACCGQKRALAAANGRAVEAQRSEAQRPRPASRVALYQYTGTTGMTVLGRVSGLKYRFGQPGATVQVDPRDVASMAGLPNLRRLG
jgi:hypothetical protein